MVRWLADTLIEVLGQATADLVMSALPIVVLLVLSLPVYFLLKLLGFGRRNTTFREDVREAIQWRPGAADYARNPMARELNQAGIYLRTGLQYFLGLVLILATVFIVWFFIGIQHDASRQFLELYFGVGYLILVVATVGKIFALQREKRGKQRLETQVSQIVMDFARLDPQILQTAKIHLDVGGPIESVCSFANQHYNRWPDSQRLAFETWLLSQIQSAIAHEGTATQSAEPVQAFVMSGGAPAEQFQAPVMAIEPQTQHFEPPVMAAQPPAQPWLTAKQITVAAIAFALALAGFTTLFLFMRIRQ